jgi:hypothetical protein
VKAASGGDDGGSSGGSTGGGGTGGTGGTGGGGGGTANNAPTISSTPTATPSTVLLASGTSVQFSVAATDRDNDPLTYTWDFGDGTSGTLANPTHVYATRDGQLTARVTVTDNRGGSVSGTTTVNVRTLTGNWRDTSGQGDVTFITQNGSNLTIPTPSLPAGYSYNFTGTIRSATQVVFTGVISGPDIGASTSNLPGFGAFTSAGTLARVP